MTDKNVLGLGWGEFDMYIRSIFSKKTYSATGMLALLSTTACDNSPFVNKSDDATGKGACASVTTSAGVKAALFSKSRQGNPGAEARISELEQGSVARLEQPVVDQVDQQTEKTTCSATLVLSLPPGSKVSKGIDEEQKIRIRYSVQPSADGIGIVYEVFGGEALAAALAGKQPTAKKTTQPAIAPPLVTGKQTGYYYIRGLNPQGDNWLALKTEPNLRSRRIAQLGPETLLVSDGTRVGEWLKVETLDGRNGWVAAKFTACCR